MIINVYKPKGWTSFDVVAKVRGILGIKKIGHSGTLDPLAEGVLVLLTEADTKKQTILMLLDKEYEAKIAFGIDSPTYDMEGPLLMVADYPDKETVLLNLKNFIGDIAQRVPAYSAVKVNGKRLYKEARSGRIDEQKLPVKNITIFSIDVISFENEEIEVNGGVSTLPVLHCKVTCSSGTYIRSLAHDLGGVLISLKRTRIGTYRIEDSKTLESLAELRPAQS